MVFENEFYKITDPKILYGYVKIDAVYSSLFSYNSQIEWSDVVDEKIFEECIIRGIKDAINEYGCSELFGAYTLLGIKISNNVDESVPIAYYWAAKNAINNFLTQQVNTI